ncbi:MAG: TolC family protein, partial [Muribaculaceae bacterium]|nr:TolC family protein [Muribaculaceae bacterium]
KVNKKRIASFFLAGACACFSGKSEEHKIFTQVMSDNLIVASGPVNTPSEWSYSDCVEWAVSHNTDIRRTLLSILQADEDIAQAKDAWLPSVDFSTNHSYLNYPLKTAGRSSNIYNSSYGVNAAWTVWEGNVRKYRLESARLLKRQQQLAGEDQVKELQVAILQVYLNILYSKEAIEIAEKTLEVSAAQTDRMRKLVDSGRQSKVDLAQIESQMAQDQYNLTQAESNLAANKISLKTLLALGIEDSIEIADVRFPDSEVTAPLLSMEEAYTAAVAWLPAFKSNRVSTDIYANDVRIAEATDAPNIALQGGVGTGYATGGRDWGYQMGHGLNENIGLSLSIPIYDANKKKRAVAKANLAAYEADIDREQLENDLAKTIESLYIDLRNAQAKYRSGVAQLESMEVTSQLVNRQFELGLVNPLDLLTAHNNLLNARLEQLQNKYMAILASKTITFYATQQVAMP